MIGLLIMAAGLRCAVASLCPTDQDIRAAKYRAANEAIPQIANATETGDPGEIVLIHPAPIRHVRDVHCGEADDEQPDVVSCSFNFKTSESRFYEVAKLKRARDGWTIMESMGVRHPLGR